MSITQKEIYTIEKMIPRYQTIFSDYSPLMALDQFFKVDKNSDLKRKINAIAWDFYFRIQTNLIELMQKYNVELNLDNLKNITEECKRLFYIDCYYFIVIKKQEIKKLKNPWYESEIWYKERIEQYNNV